MASKKNGGSAAQAGTPTPSLSLPGFGRASATAAKTPKALKDQWAQAKALNEADPNPELGEWVPSASIQVVESVLPRTVTDPETVERYVQCFFETPAITVQRDSFILVGGLHRLKASEAVHGVIRIRELDVADAGLFEAALLDNRTHGKPLTQTERTAAGHRLLAMHHPITGGLTGDAWTASLIAATVGIAERTVQNWLDGVEVPADAPRARERRGVDNKVRPVRTQANAGAAQRGKGNRTNGTAQSYQNSAALRKVTTIETVDATSSPTDRSWKTVQRVAIIVSSAIEEMDNEETGILQHLLPEHAARLGEIAKQALEFWGRVADAALQLEDYHAQSLEEATPEPVA